jgi:hypothetical protein
MTASSASPGEAQDTLNTCATCGAAECAHNEHARQTSADHCEGASCPNHAHAHLRDDFWERRDWLRQIRTAAFSRSASPDAYLGCALARQAAMLNHAFTIPAVVGHPSAVNLYVALLGDPGAGKSVAFHESAYLFPDSDLYTISAGSGEGLVEAYMGSVESDTEKLGNGKPKSVRKQVRHNVLVYTDEGEAYNARNNRDGATLRATMRAMWTGSTIGEHNASAEKRRFLAGGSYSLGLIIAFQPAVIGPLLADVDTGTPQRFLCLSATHPDIPDNPPEWPGELPRPNVVDQMPAHRAQAMPGDPREGVYSFGVAESIQAEIRATHLAKNRGVSTVDPMDSHRGLHRLKIAAIFAYWDSTLDISEDHWALAGQVLDTSDAVRGLAQKAVRLREARSEAAYSTKLGARQAIANDYAQTHSIDQVARRLAGIVRHAPGILTPGKARVKLSRPQRRYFDDALEYGLAHGWIQLEETPGQGEAAARLHPGTVQPIPTSPRGWQRLAANPYPAGQNGNPRSADTNPITPPPPHGARTSQHV